MTTIAMTTISAPMTAMIEISVVWLNFSDFESEIEIVLFLECNFAHNSAQASSTNYYYSTSDLVNEHILNQNYACTKSQSNDGFFENMNQCCSA